MSPRPDLSPEEIAEGVRRMLPASLLEKSATVDVNPDSTVTLHLRSMLTPFEAAAVGYAVAAFPAKVVVQDHPVVDGNGSS